MNIKPKCHNQEDFELDNVYNDEDRVYNEASNSTIWYTWRKAMIWKNQSRHNRKYSVVAWLIFLEEETCVKILYDTEK